MIASTRTTEGIPSDCPMCGKRMSVAPGEPLGDILCPHCGTLVVPDAPLKKGAVPDDMKRLAELGVNVDTDDEGEVTRIQLNGFIYNDQAIPRIARLTGIPIIDIRNASISHEGAARLRNLLPDAVIEH